MKNFLTLVFCCTAATALSQVDTRVDGSTTYSDLNMTDLVLIIETLQTDVAALEAANNDLLQYLTVNTDNNTLTISGANLHVNSGEGATDSGVNGFGNIIIGYDEDSGADDKTGSHNLVIGKEHTYSSYGGIVVGENNSITAVYSSILGGKDNTASNPNSSVLGGYQNTASGYGSSVSGGYDNTASDSYSSISGGRNNHASNWYSSVSGGQSNHASSWASSVSGGYGNTATLNNWSSVSGGQSNTASGENSSILGGSGNTASGANSVDTGE